MKRLTNFAIKRGHLIAAAVLGSSLCLVALASTVTLPNTFTAGTTASAAQVNANFNAIKSAVDDNFSRLPKISASTDTSFQLVRMTAAGPTETNSVTIVAPSAGVIMISGSVVVTNVGPAQRYSLRAMGNGLNLFSTSISQYSAPDAFVVGPTTFPMAYTVTVPVSAGTHTISQAVGPELGTTDFSYNKNNLSVIYFPASQATLTPNITPL